MRSFLFFIFFFFISSSFAQNIRGKVTDSSQHPLPAATVQLNQDISNSQVAQTITDSLGNYSFSNADSGNFTIIVSFVGYGTTSGHVHIVKDSLHSDSLFTMAAIPLFKASGTLAGVTVTANAPAVTQKADTIQYSANQYKVNPDATSEDLIKKMPGITVGTDGTVTAHGDQVKKVLVDGKEYFGDDATATLRNLPAEVIDKIQVFDKLSDQAQFTGFDDGNSQRTINIVTKGGLKNSQFGKVYTGYGTDDRYTAGGNVNFFNGNRRIALIGLTNNINQQNFSQQDLLGVLSSGSNSGRGGGGSRGGNSRGGGGPSGGAGNFLTGNSNGINTTNSIGINYSDMWGKKLSVTGSYFFNNSKNITAQTTNRQYYTDDAYHEDLTSENNNYNHRMNLRMEYKIDSSNQIVFTPVLSFQNNYSQSLTAATSTSALTKSQTSILNDITTNSSGYNFSANLLYRHAFHKRGRSLSFGITPGLTDNTGETYQDIVNDTINNGKDSLLFRDKNSHTKSIAGSIAYTEPVGKKAMLQFNYNPSYQNNTAKQLVNHFDDFSGKYSQLDTSQSNLFNNDITKHNAGVSYHIGDRYNNFMVGLNYQYTDMISNQTYPEGLTIHKTFNNLLPNVMFNKKLGTKSNIRIFYRASTQTPSVTQLQNVYNTSNPLYVSTGNPDLKQSYGNTMAARFTFTNTVKSSSFFLNAFVQQNNNYITNATYTTTKDSVLTPTITLDTGSTVTKPVNLNGYGSYRTLATYSFPIKAVKTNISINGGFSYTRQPGLVNYQENISNNYQYSGGLVLASNISEYVDFTISYTPAYNVVRNSVQPKQNQNYYSGSAVGSLNLLSKNGWVFHTDVTNQLYTGLSAGYNQNYTLWNASAGKKFLKNQRGDLRLSVFDILKQNQSILRSVEPNYIEDVRTNVLQRYFMLTFTYKINNVRNNVHNNVPKPSPTAPNRNHNRNEESPRGNEPPAGPPPGSEPADGPPPQGEM